MDVKKVSLIYFSPTGTTRNILKKIAEGITSQDVAHFDVTLPDGAPQPIPSFSGELVLIGAPVYGGRLPVDAVNRFKQLKADKTPAVLVVVYGNRDFDDALLELKHLSVELGFVPVAGGAFIGEHSFATKDVPIANGRPDDMDDRKAKAFGAKIKEKISALPSSDALTDLEIPGRFPYEGGTRAMAVAPVTMPEICTLCATCAGVCPKAAISINGSVTTRIELCIRCCACIKNCPEGARVWEDPKMKEIADWLKENCATRKEPRLFGVDPE